jgi:hypothetical protein
MTGKRLFRSLSTAVATHFIGAAWISLPVIIGQNGDPSIMGGIDEGCAGSLAAATYRGVHAGAHCSAEFRR